MQWEHIVEDIERGGFEIGMHIYVGWLLGQQDWAVGQERGCNWQETLWVLRVLG